MDGYDDVRYMQADAGQPEQMVKITARIGGEVDKVIKELSEGFGVSASNVIRMAIDGHLEKYLGTLRYVDKAQGEEIRRCICVTANKMQEIKNQLRRIGINVNQLAKYQNIGSKINDLMGQMPYMSGTEKVEAAGQIRLYREQQAKLNLCEIKMDELIKLVGRYEAAAKELGDALWRIRG